MKRIVIAFALSVATISAWACSTIVVGKNASKTGRVIVGHNEDDDGPIVVKHALVPEQTHPEGETLPAERGCAAIPQVGHTLGFYWSEVKAPEGGLSNADVFLNEKGVFVVSNNGLSDPPEDAASTLTDGGIGFNLRRAIAERATSARDAVTIITNLVTTWGYMMPGRMYTVADKDEAWTVEIVRGRRFVARRCPDDHVVVIPNCYTIHELEPGDIVSPDIMRRAKTEASFDFAKAYQGGPERWKRPNDVFRFQHMYRLAAGRDFPKHDCPFSAKPRALVGIEELKAALSTHYEGTPDEVRPKHGDRTDTKGLMVCRDSTVESTICAFGQNLRETELSVALGSPCSAGYVKFSPFGEGMPPYLNESETALERLAHHLEPMANEETPYQFRQRLECVHEPGRRDTALLPAADEFVFTSGMKVGNEDFADYLKVSMGVEVSAESGGMVTAKLDATLDEREYQIEVTKDALTLRAANARMLAQAYYHLEDLMNLRCAPFLKVGTERRRLRFSPRMIHSGYGCDIFPDNYLKLIAHHGFDAIVFYIKDVNKTAAGRDQDVNGIIERARRVGLDTYLYSSVSCFAHPQDPNGRKEIEECFGRIAKAHPGAKGMVFVGESCQFPSRDERCQPVRHQDKNHNDPRPLAGWFPCRDYPDWLRAVMDAMRQYSPNMEIVFWTYNWSRQDERICAELIPNFPDGVAIQGTLGNNAVIQHDNGLTCICRDYTMATAGFTSHYAAQARAAKASNRRFYTMANTAGLTWDYGVAQYLPCPYQWKKRWDGLKDPQYGIAGLMETHHFGWYPSFISELAKEAYTEGGMAFEEHLSKIAARDFGAQNVDKVLDAWRKWSKTEEYYVANNENQYGPFRIGPAFPYNFGGRWLTHEEFPQDKKAYHTMRWMAILNFPYDLRQAREQNVEFSEIDDDYRLKQLELFERMRDNFADGVKTLKGIALTLDGARRRKAEEMIGVGEWHQRTVETAINLNRGYLAYKRGDQAGVMKYARAEYANAQAALKLVERDSRLGWEPSMEYAAGPRQIRWKLRLMEELYPTLK